MYGRFVYVSMERDWNRLSSREKISARKAPFAGPHPIVAHLLPSG